MKRLLFIIFFALFGMVGNVAAQDVALKTNLLYWATTTPNLGLEIGLSPRTTLDIRGGYNPWTLDEVENKKLKHWAVTPEFRYWFCERFQGHFLGFNAGYMYYNVSAMRIPFFGEHTKDHRYQGWATGVGISYGHSWILGGRWNLEASVGVGYAYTEYDVYECATCGEHLGPNDKHYVGPTKLAINLVYMIK